MIENWRVIINGAYSVRFSLAAAVTALVVAWQTKSIEAIIPAALALAAIVARIIPQPALHATKRLKDAGKN
jgi:uncharacterized membrane protein YhaH (DUF805 family)